MIIISFFIINTFHIHGVANKHGTFVDIGDESTFITLDQICSLSNVTYRIRNTRDHENYTNRPTMIILVDGPEDVTGDDIPDIGFINPNVETGYQFSILLQEKNPLVNEAVPVSNSNVSLSITLWDASGIRYINTTTMKTNNLGRIDFNFTGFRSDDGISINTPGLGACGKAFFQFQGNDTFGASEEELDLNYFARPIPLYVEWSCPPKPEPESFFTQHMFLVGGFVIYAIITILIGIFICKK